jgi:maleamate amidohydrolase
MSDTWRPWDDRFSDEERAVREAGGYGRHGGVGTRPAILVIDVVRNFTGYPGQSHLESIKTFRSSCGPVAWQAIPHIRTLIAAARERKIPVIFTRATRLPDGLRLAQRRKNSRAARETAKSVAVGSEYPEEIAPLEGEIIIEKTKPSPFFQTPLLSHLQMLGVDHLIITGCTTSGCIRAAVYDGFSYNFGQTLVLEGVFDRFETSHLVNLHDMDAKFADVLPIADVLREIDERFPLDRPAAAPMEATRP